MFRADRMFTAGHVVLQKMSKNIYLLFFRTTITMTFHDVHNLLNWMNFSVRKLFSKSIFKLFSRFPVLSPNLISLDFPLRVRVLKKTFALVQPIN